MESLQIVALVCVVVSTVVGVAIFARGLREIVRVVRIGVAAPGRLSPLWRRTWRMVSEVLDHRRFKHRPIVAVAHWSVMLSFPILVLTLFAGYGQVVDPSFSLPVLGHFPPLEWVTEAIAWASLLGILALITVRISTVARRRGRTSRFFGSNQGQAAFVEATVLVVVLAVLVLRGLEYALLAGDAATAHLASSWHFPLTGWLGEVLLGDQGALGLGGATVSGAAGSADAPLSAIGTAIVIVATIKILGSMAWFVVVGLQPAMGVAWHRFLAILNVLARRELDGSPALGPVQPMLVNGTPLDIEAIEDLPDEVRFGVGAIEDFTWKGLLDFATCTECGRCQEQCPAWNTGKPLSPKAVVLSLRDHAFATAPYLRAAAGHDGHAGPDAAPLTGTTTGGAAVALGIPTHQALPLVGPVIDADALWACTMCGACVQQCPVDIEHVDAIVDMRRYQVLMESAFPRELAGTFTKLERQGNPWGLPARARLAWAKGLDFEVPVVGVDVESAADVEYLFWVGCAGAYEDRAKATTRAVAELMHMAGVSFAVLGDGESCTGDPARRAGNEVLFQMLASANVETLTEVGAQRIVVTCAHCFNTIAREYPQLGGRFEVVHHTELLGRLVEEGRLVPVAPEGSADTDERITYHDPCFLGRHNKIYTPPRELLGALPGVELVEMPRNTERSFCCGAGGARMWMEETIGTRINAERAGEAVATGAEIIATACPYCTVMLSDGVAANAAHAPEGSPAAKRPRVADVAVLLLERVQKDENA